MGKKLKSYPIDLPKTECSAIIAAIGDGITIHDRNYKIIFQNPVMLDWFGNRIGESCYLAYQDNSSICNACPVVLCFNDGKSHDSERKALVKGQWRIFENKASLVLDENGTAVAAVEVVRDITERKEAEERIARFRDLYAAISRTNKAIIHCESPQDLYEHICQIAVEFGGFILSFIGIIQKDGNITAVAHHGTASAYLDSLVVHSHAGRLEGQGPTGRAIRDGKPYICNDFHKDPNTTPWRKMALENGIHSSAAFPLRNEGRIIGALKVYSAHIGFFDAEVVDLLVEMSVNISFALDNFKYIEKLHYANTHDLLTGLFNRSFYDAEIERMKSSRHYPVSIVIADVDGLKQVNDNFGHAAGDHLIKRAAQALKESFRNEDMVARIGGDEFAVILPAADEEMAKRTIKRVLETLEENNRSDGETRKVSISLGSATADSAEQLDETLKLADSRMYHYKKKKKKKQFEALAKLF